MALVISNKEYIIRKDNLSRHFISKHLLGHNSNLNPLLSTTIEIDQKYIDEFASSLKIEALKISE